MNTTTLRGLRAATRFPTTSTKYTVLDVKKPSTEFLQLRYASSVPSTPHKSTPPLQKLSDINGPLTTLPPPLDLPIRKEDQSLPSYLFATGKTYVTFYKTGIKNIYTNYKLSSPIQSRVSKSTLQQLVSSNSITRSEYQLLFRNWHDIKRVPLFGLVLLVCGEFTPLVVIAFTAVVPWTCRIPKQIDSDRRKLEERRGESFRELTSLPPSPNPGMKVEEAVEKLDKWQLRHINSSLSLSSSLWSWIFGPPSFLLKRRVKAAISYLEMDDTLINRAGGVAGMSGEEVKIACVERGINVMGMKEEKLKEFLGSWLRSREKVGVERLLLTRPNVWPVRTNSPETKRVKL
jgi:hypothetical protein